MSVTCLLNIIKTFLKSGMKMLKICMCVSSITRFDFFFPSFIFLQFFELFLSLQPNKDRPKTMKACVAKIQFIPAFNSQSIQYLEWWIDYSHYSHCALQWNVMRWCTSRHKTATVAESFVDDLFSSPTHCDIGQKCRWATDTRVHASYFSVLTTDWQGTMTTF